MEGHTTIQLRIKTLTKEVIRVTIGLTDNVMKLKELIHATKQEYPISKQKLIHRGKYMLNEALISSFIFLTKDVIMLMIDKSDEQRQPDVNTSATNQTSSDNEARKESEDVDIRPILSISRGVRAIEVNAENLDDTVDLAIYSMVDYVQSSEQLKTLKGHVDNTPEIITDVVQRIGDFANFTMDDQVCLYIYIYIYIYIYHNPIYAVLINSLILYHIDYCLYDCLISYILIMLNILVFISIVIYLFIAISQIFFAL